MAVFLAMIVMPFSRSRSIESMTRSATCSWAPKVPLCQSIASTSVVLPWSTWAMMARLRTSSLVSEFKTGPLVLGEGKIGGKVTSPAGTGRIPQSGGGELSGQPGRLQGPHAAQRLAHGLHFPRLEIGELAAGADPRRHL